MVFWVILATRGLWEGEATAAPVTQLLRMASGELTDAECNAGMMASSRRTTVRCQRSTL